MTTRTRGFTLIELLVVIAIIGILSAIVLASLNSARDKGGDAAIQSDLHAIINQAQLYHDGPGNGSYGTASDCTSGMFTLDSTISSALSAADKANGPDGTIACNSDGTSYAVAAQLTASPTSWWCIDSTGAAKNESAAIGAATACP